MAKKFAHTGTQQAPSAAAPGALNQSLAPFISGGEPITTMTVQVPIRLKQALKRQALDDNTTMRELLTTILETHFTQSSFKMD